MRDRYANCYGMCGWVSCLCANCGRGSIPSVFGFHWTTLGQHVARRWACVPSEETTPLRTAKEYDEIKKQQTDWVYGRTNDLPPHNRPSEEATP